MNDFVQQPFPGLMGTASDGTSVPIVGWLAARRVLSEWQEIPLQSFEEMFRKKAGKDFAKHWPKVEHLYKEYGPVLSIPIGSALLYAAEDKRLEWCIELLEQHFKDDLQYQHPELRGRLIIGNAGANRSHIFIANEIVKVLRLHLFTK